MAMAMGREGEEGRGRRGSWSEDLAKFHPSPHFCNEVNKVNKLLLLSNNFC
jgi:hypothetical protein